MRYLVQRELDSVDITQTIGIVSDADVSVNTGDEAAIALALVKEAYGQTSMDPKPRDEHRIIELGTQATVYPWADSESSKA